MNRISLTLSTILSMAFTQAIADPKALEAFQFIVDGDIRDPLITDISFSNCKSQVTVNTIILGTITIKHNWNEAIWNSQNYYINDNEKIELMLSCRTTCAEYMGEAAELMSLASLMTGIELTKSIRLEIGASQMRVNRALQDLRDECPGVSSKY
jgi:hypothetical protein